MILSTRRCALQPATQYPVALRDGPVADGTMLLDVRSAEEYSGVKRYAQHGGHIPGAVQLE